MSPLLALALCLPLASPAKAAEGKGGGASVTLSRLCRAALEHAEEVRSADARARRAQGEAGQARGALLPTLSARADAQAFTESQTVDIPFPIVAVPDRRETLSTTLEQPLFAGGSLVGAWRGRKDAARAADEERRSARESVVGETAELAYRWLEADEVLRQARAALERRSAHYDDAERRREAGLATDADASRAQAELQQAKADELEAEREAFEARKRLEALTGLDLDSAPVVPERLSAPDGGPGETAANPEILAAAARASSAEQYLKTADGAWFPRLSIGGQELRTYESPQTLLFVKDQTLGFARLDWDIFSGGRTRAAQASARASYDEAVQTKKRLERDRAVDAEVARERLRQADALVEAEKARAEAARSGYETASRRYGSGLDGYLIRLDAETELTSAEAAWTRAKFRRERAVLELYAARGQLEAELVR